MLFPHMCYFYVYMEIHIYGITYIYIIPHTHTYIYTPNIVIIRIAQMKLLIPHYSGCLVLLSSLFTNRLFSSLHFSIVDDGHLHTDVRCCR